MHPEGHPNVDRSPESLEARLRALAAPSIPVDLEARLLAAIPSVMPKRRRRWPVWVGLVGALAAACLLAILAWPGFDGTNPGPRASPVESATPRPSVRTAPAFRPLDESTSIAALRGGAEPPTFTWPLPETSPLTVSTSIPADLLD
jgi:hypothetical protein